MRPLLFALSILSIAVLQSGCRTARPTRPYGFARLDPFPCDGSAGTTLSSEESAPPLEPEKRLHWKGKVRKLKGEDREPDPPRLLFRVTFLHSVPDRFRAHGIDLNQGTRVLATGKGADLMRELTADPMVAYHGSPQLATFSGQPASIYMGDQKAYVKGYSAQGSAEHCLFEPLLGRYDTGRSLNVEATLEDGKIVFSRIEVKTSQLLGLRRCRADVTTGLFSWEKLTWLEPMLYVGAASLPAGAGSVEISGGEVIVMPLHYRVVHAPSSTRALAKGGEVEESYENRFGLTELSPLNLQTVALVTAELLP
ncbi:MAG: hypothetical protein ACYTFG_09260 [Planctomycetota bacterium]|jgi:hypothetical protein